MDKSNFILLKRLYIHYHIMENSYLSPLEKVTSVVDLGVLFDPNLTFRDHISENINKAYSVPRTIKQNFIYDQIG